MADDEEVVGPNPLDITVVEEESEGEHESSDEFNFNDVTVLKKNLSVTFDQHVRISATNSVVAQQIARFEQSIHNSAVAPVLTRPQKLSVALRIRPPVGAKAIDSGKHDCSAASTVELLSATTLRTYPPPDSQTAKSSRGETAGVKDFEFSSIFGPDTPQGTLYEQMAAPLVQGLVTGNHSSALLFSYGITNAGKTYTMLGNLSNPDEWGILPRAMQELSAVPGWELMLSYLEIYNEQIFDLLPSDCAARLVPLKITGASVVAGLSKHPVVNVQAGLDLVKLAKTKRHTSCNNLNNKSSRSHSICQLDLVTATKSKTFWVVDLAGSERSKRTGIVNSTRQREATLINASLMKLMRCLLPDGDVIPFRESKLTHLIMHHLVSGGTTSMMVNINPAAADFDETQHVLAYASAAKTVDINMEDYVKKRKAMGLEVASHGLDGKSLKRVALESSDRPPSKISKLARHFSPKKAFSRMTTKRKTEEQETTKQFRTKLDQLAANKINPEKEIQLLKTHLSIAQAEAEVHKHEIQNLHNQIQSEAEAHQHEKQILQEELQEMESQVRMEAAEEMQVQLQAMREEYDAMCTERDRKTQPTPSRLAKKAQMDMAQGIMDDLVEKVEECEEEMKRMREEHSEELATLSENHERVVMMLNSELAILKNAMDGERRLLKERIQDLEQEVAHLQERKMKDETDFHTRMQELEGQLESKRNLLERDEFVNPEVQSSPVDEKNEPSIENIASAASPKKSLPRSRVSKVAGDVEKRAPFGDLGNISEYELFFPKKPAALDETTGIFKRPSGRAPLGRDWDERAGGWRLSQSE